MATLAHTMDSTAKSVDTVTELLWQDALRHLKATNNEVLLPTNVRDIIGQDSVNKIKSRLSALLGVPVVGFIDDSINAFRLMRTPAFSGSAVSVASHDAIPKAPKKGPIEPTTKTGEKSSMPSKGAKIPRPPNAFILYRQHHHPKIKEAYPDFQNNDICKPRNPVIKQIELTELAIMLGKQWKAESDEIRANYKALADDQKQKHAEEHPDYQYTPRRPCERKRRASSRQYAKNSKAAAEAGVAAANAKSYNQGQSFGQSFDQSRSHSQMIAESPTSMTSAATLSSVSTPGMQAGDSNTGRDLSGLNVYLGPNDLQDERFNFDTVSFDAIVQQLRNSQNQDFMFQPLEPAEQAAVDSFEFSDYIADCF